MLNQHLMLLMSSIVISSTFFSHFVSVWAFSVFWAAALWWIDCKQNYVEFSTEITHWSNHMWWLFSPRINLTWFPSEEIFKFFKFPLLPVGVFWLWKRKYLSNKLIYLDNLWCFSFSLLPSTHEAATAMIFTVKNKNLIFYHIRK